MTWEDNFRRLWKESVSRYQEGQQDWRNFFDPEHVAWLDQELGYRPREFFDFVEDFCEWGEPDEATSLGVAALRRSYFMGQQKGVRSEKMLKKSDLPGMDRLLGGIPWLPRILCKARAKLRGELDPDMMYGCGGDRAFLKKVGRGMVEFLQKVEETGEDDQAMLAFVQAQQ